MDDAARTTKTKEAPTTQPTTITNYFFHARHNTRLIQCHRRLSKEGLRREAPTLLQGSDVTGGHAATAICSEFAASIFVPFGNASKGVTPVPFQSWSCPPLKITRRASQLLQRILVVVDALRAEAKPGTTSPRRVHRTRSCGRRGPPKAKRPQKSCRPGGNWNAIGRSLSRRVTSTCSAVSQSASPQLTDSMN